MTQDLHAAALRWRAAARPAVVVEVLRTRGSVPREAGTRLLVAADETLGSIGGGHLEWQAVAAARALLARGGGAFEQHVALGPTLGQCCGGVLDLRYTLLADDDPAAWPGTTPRFTLQLYGAGHVGRAIVALLAETVPADELLRIGYLDALVPAARLDAEVDALADALAAGAPLALRGMKQSLNDIARGEFDLPRLSEREALCAASDDLREGLAAFAAKREPVFGGR